METLGIIFMLLLYNSVMVSESRRVNMIQEQACYYQGYNRELVCQCSEDNSYLHLRLREFVVNARQEISRIQLNSCPDVVLSLDLESVEPGVQTLEIKNSQNVKIESIKFDPKFENQQRLRMMFSNVVRAVLSNLEVTETLQVDVKNVKSFKILNSTFAHIPQLGISVSSTGNLQIMDNIFLKVYPMSIMLEKTKYVEVRNNQFSMNAIQVISYKDGSSVLISCNRLLGDFIKPECIPTTTTTTTTTTPTTTTTTPSTTSTTSPRTSTTKLIVVEKEVEANTGVVIILVILLSLLLIIISGLIAAVCFLKWNKIKKELFHVTSQAPLIEGKEKEETELLTKPVVIPEPPPPPPPVELEALLSSKSQKDKVQLFAPIWLEEIQSNKIYKKYSERNQKIEEDKLNKNDTNEEEDESGKKETPEEHKEQDAVQSGEEKEESSRTESDQEC